MKAIWKDTLIAQSNETIVIEGNHYFPPDAVDKQYLVHSDMLTQCPWKGTANYYSIEVDGEQNKDAAWFYPEPKDAAKQIKGYVAFWRGVDIVE